ncbi:LuxR C-terminal-related transcriptional regulator [Cupriavidus metallidurans]|uniref:LuxR C-terminal-related transcriptional regulator n=1 Tax=Cupriavidus metallidurans TaxID=119219 RepID=UPI000561B7FC|nr:LuxR C-terminal-related transcriptional regulator [Cupriavidus metallidurans]
MSAAISRKPGDSDTQRRGLVASKLVPPRALPNHLVRSRLVDVMVDAASARLILVRAAAGFGKTTLMQQYLERCQAGQRACVWLRCDAADNDLQRFLLHLHTGLLRLPGLTRHQRDERSDTIAGETIAHEIIEIAASYAQPFAILLDDLEVIQNDAITEYLQQLVRVLSPQGVLVIGTRATPDLGLGGLRARGQLLDINPAALRFSAEEAASFIRDNCELPLQDGEIATLWRCTEGWAAAVYLATLSLRGHPNHAAFVRSFSGTNIELAEYLAEDILMGQSESCRDFLLQTSLLGQLSAPLCDAVTGRHDSREMLSFLERNNLFITPLDGEHQWYRYHSLFASFLQHRLQVTYPDKARALHVAASRWYLSEDRPVPAIEHLLQAGLDDEALPLIAIHTPALFQAGRVRLLARWLDRIDRKRLLADPHRMGLAYAWVLLLNRRYAEAMQTMAALLAADVPADQQAWIALEVETLRCVLLAMTDQIETCLAAGLAHLERIPPDARFRYASVANSLAFSLVASHRYEDARRVLSRLMQGANDVRTGFQRSIADSLEGIIDLVQGRLSNALARFRAVAERGWSPSEVSSLRHAFLPAWATALYEANALEDCARVLAEAMPYCKGYAPPDAMIAGFILSARLALLGGDRDRWLRMLAELEEIGRGIQLPRAICSAWLERARVATIEGRLDAADQALRSAELHADWAASDSYGHANDIDFPDSIRWRLAIAHGEHEQTASELADAIAIATQRQRHWRALKLRLLLAMALDGAGKQSEAFEQLTEALRLASHEGLARTFLDEGDRLADLLRRWADAREAECVRAGIDLQFVRTVLAQIPAPLAAAGVEVNQARGTAIAEPLTTREQEVLQMLAAGHRNRVIAEKMFVSELTIKSHLRKINAKLGAQSRTEAVAIGRSLGLLR